MPMRRMSQRPDDWVCQRPEHLPPAERRRLERNGGVAPHKRRSGEMERYLPEHGRMELAACEHTQILDIVAGHTAHCLDCGAVVDIAHGWSVVPGTAYLGDADLVEKRIYFNNFWFDQRYKMQPSDPDDPEREAQIHEELRKKGMVRLDARHIQ